RPLRPRWLPLRRARGDCHRRTRLRLGADVACGGGHWGRQRRRRLGECHWRRARRCGPRDDRQRSRASRYPGVLAYVHSGRGDCAGRDRRRDHGRAGPQHPSRAPAHRQDIDMMRKLPQWELTLIVLTLGAGAWSAYLSPYYLSFDQIAESTRHFVFPGILAIGLAVVVILGEIDISLASTLAFGAVLFSKFSAFGVTIWIATPLVIAACAALGALNGVLVALLGLPSLAVTLGTMGAFRGLAFILGSETGYTDFDDSYLYVGSEPGFGSVPISF